MLSHKVVDAANVGNVGDGVGLLWDTSGMRGDGVGFLGVGLSGVI
jgi:hypothetical protein